MFSFRHGKAGREGNINETTKAYFWVEILQWENIICVLFCVFFFFFVCFCFRMIMIINLFCRVLYAYLMIMIN